jgi:hypothetical protein
MDLTPDYVERLDRYPAQIGLLGSRFGVTGRFGGTSYPV